jgi:hypothetical protein
MQNIQIKYALVWAIFVLLGFAANLPTEAWAGIASTQGDIEVVAPPASVQRQAYESSSEIRVFLESEQTVDSIPVNAVLPGTYHAYSDFVDQTLVPNGPIDSYFIHYDVEGQTLAQASGSITFDEPILAVIGRSLTLQQTDGTLGAPGTLYPTNRFDRELEYETRGNYDFFRLDPDGHTIFIQVEDSTDVDQIRVVTAVPEPSTMTLALVSVALLFRFRRLSRVPER